MPWNFGDILDTIEPLVDPRSPAMIQGEAVTTWGELSCWSNNLARALVERGAAPLERVAICLRNGPAYAVALSACFKARLAQVNVNYRYGPTEIRHILEDSDATIIIYGSEFRDVFAQLAPEVSGIGTWIEVGDERDVAPFALGFWDLARNGEGGPLAIPRSPDDQLFLYTGGTTGLPKGVVWAQGALHDLFQAAARARGSVPGSLEDLRGAMMARQSGRPTLILPPLMHGTGLFNAIMSMLNGDCIQFTTSRSLDPLEVLMAIERARPATVILAGDAFARPILAALDADPGRHDVTSVATLVSSGAMCSRAVKQGLLDHMPSAEFKDGFSSSEAIGMGTSVMTADREMTTARFSLSDRCRVFQDDDRPTEPGSGMPGRIAVGPPIPLGYHKDPEKTAQTFRTVDGIRYAFSGDWGLVNSDGSVTLLGRGNASINSGGEKIFAEEVEEVLKTHPSVVDALVVGLPDERWGSAVTGIVALEVGATLDEAGIKAHVRGVLAGFKVPKHVYAADRPLRLVNGKADYDAARMIGERGRSAGI